MVQQSSLNCLNFYSFHWCSEINSFCEQMWCDVRFLYLKFSLHVDTLFCAVCQLNFIIVSLSPNINDRRKNKKYVIRGNSCLLKNSLIHMWTTFLGSTKLAQMRGKDAVKDISRIWRLVYKHIYILLSPIPLLLWLPVNFENNI